MDNLYNHNIHNIEKLILHAASLLRKNHFFIARDNIVNGCQKSTALFQLSLLLKIQDYCEKLNEFLKKEKLVFPSALEKEAGAFFKAAENISTRFYDVIEHSKVLVRETLPKYTYSEANNALEIFLTYYEHNFYLLDTHETFLDELNKKAGDFLHELLNEKALTCQVKKLLKYYQMPPETCHEFLVGFDNAEKQFQQYFHYFHPVKDLLEEYRQSADAILYYGQDPDSKNWFFQDPQSADSPEIRNKENSILEKLKLQGAVVDDFSDDVPCEIPSGSLKLPPNIAAALEKEISSMIVSPEPDRIEIGEGKTWTEISEQLLSKVRTSYMDSDGKMQKTNICFNSPQGVGPKNINDLLINTTADAYLMEEAADTGGDEIILAIIVDMTGKYLDPQEFISKPPKFVSTKIQWTHVGEQLDVYGELVDKRWGEDVESICTWRNNDGGQVVEPDKPITWIEEGVKFHATFTVSASDLNRGKGGQLRLLLIIKGDKFAKT